MSFILDALKKSETERQQQGTAEFAAVPVSSRRNTIPGWLWLIGLLLAVNLVVLAGLLLRPAATTERTAPVTRAAAETSVETETAPSFIDQVAVAQSNTPFRGSPDTAVAVADSPAPAQAESSTAFAPAVVANTPDDAAQPSAFYPGFDEVRASGAINTVDLHLDIHVFSEVPKDRFVFINMSKHREGSRLEEGPLVDEITPDGVVLTQNGRSFLLSRE